MKKNTLGILLVLVLLYMLQRKPSTASPAPGAINQANSDLSQALAGGGTILDSVEQSVPLIDIEGNPVAGGAAGGIS